jgi:hypothetical protein
MEAPERTLIRCVHAGCFFRRPRRQEVRWYMVRVRQQGWQGKFLVLPVKSCERIDDLHHAFRLSRCQYVTFVEHALGLTRSSSAASTKLSKFATVLSHTSIHSVATACCPLSDWSDARVAWIGRRAGHVKPSPRRLDNLPSVACSAIIHQPRYHSTKAPRTL